MNGHSVAVIIPAYNAASSIAETLESVLAQSVQPSEIIVVDDGSRDGTAAAVAAFGSRVTLLAQDNAGQSRARNAGARASRAEWLAFLDADDLWLPEKLERQLVLASADVGLIYCDRINIGDLDGLPEVQSALQPLIEGDVFEALLHGNVITTSGVLVRRAVFEAVGGFREEAPVQPAEDWDLWLRIAAEHRVAACRAPLVKYRLHRQGVSHQTVRMNAARMTVVARALDSPRGRRLPPATRRRIWHETWATNAWDAARHGRIADACLADLRAIACAPFAPGPWVHLARMALGRT